MNNAAEVLLRDIWTAPSKGDNKNDADATIPALGNRHLRNLHE